MSEHCYFCGLDSSEFINHGKFGCEFCPDFLSMIPEVEYILQKTNPWNKNKDSSPKISQKIPRSFQWDMGKNETIYFSSRYRIARNIRRSFFINRGYDREAILDFLHSYFPRLKLIQKKGFVEYWSSWEEKENLKINFLVGDEDQIRWEICWQGVYNKDIVLEVPIFARKNRLVSFISNRQLFSYHKNWGFLNSCPTNCGRGDRFSLILQKNSPPGLNSNFQEDWFLEGDGIRLSILDFEKKQEKRGISIKNFNKRRKFYFQQSLLPLIFKDSGEMEVPKLSSNI
ncbi:MAG: hypothetical protein JJT78_16695 [Leptospira sp.]|nr:hypothetical protein [Leptospira sp.]